MQRSKNNYYEKFNKNMHKMSEDETDNRVLQSKEKKKKQKWDERVRDSEREMQGVFKKLRSGTP